jgi:hypothetical protein
VRREETNAARLVADIMRLARRAELAVLNAGSLRADRVIPRGPVTLGDLRLVLPMVDSLTLLDVTGRQLLLALENGVSRCDESNGRLPCLVQLSTAYDPRLPAGQRVLPDSVLVAGAPLEPDRHHSLATKAYVAEGHVGHDVFRHVRIWRTRSSARTCPPLCETTFDRARHAQGIPRQRRGQRRERRERWRAQAQRGPVQGGLKTSWLATSRRTPWRCSRRWRAGSWA